MKPKSILITLGLVLAVLALLPACKKKAPQKSSEAPAAAAETAPVPSEERESPAAAVPLDLRLLINGAESVAVTQDTPLVFSLAIVDRAAVEASDTREALENLREQLEEQVRDQSMTRERADWLLKQEREPGPVSPLILTMSVAGFSFAVVRDGETIGFPWTLKPVAPESPALLTLDERTQGEAVFTAVAETPSRIPQGTFEVTALFEAKMREAGSWVGKIQSNPVLVTITAEAATPSDKAERSLAFAEYYLKTNDPGRAEQSVHDALAEYPTLIRGLYLQGVVLEDKGDFKAALESYQSARAEHRRRFPESKPPWDLAERVQRMLDKLGIKLPEIID